MISDEERAAGERVHDELTKGPGFPLSAREERAARHGRNCPGRADEDDCTCGLTWRDALATEQTMHAAWRKRAEEAETELITLRADLAAAVGELERIRDHDGDETCESLRPSDCLEHVQKIARDALAALRPAAGEAKGGG